MRSRTVVMLGLLAVVMGARIGRVAVVHAAPTKPAPAPTAPSPHKPTKKPHDGAKLTLTSLTSSPASWFDGKKKDDKKSGDKIAVAPKKPKKDGDKKLAMAAPKKLKKDGDKKLDAATMLVAKTKKKGFPKKADGYLFGAEVA